MAFYHRVDEKTTLAMVALGDAEEVFSLVDSSRDHLRRWLPWVDDSRSVDYTRAFIEGALKQHADGQGFPCVIRREDAVAGIVGFRHVDWANRRTEIGYWLGKGYQGLGIMTSCCAALVDFAFRELDLNRVEIHCATDNSRSRAVPERLGFTAEGTLRQVEWVNDRFVDDVVYAMLRGEWEARVAPSPRGMRCER